MERTEAAQRTASGQLLAGEQLLRNVVEADSILQDSHRLATDRLALARLEISLGKYSASAVQSFAAWQLFREIGNHANEIASMHLLARASMLSGDLEKCLALIYDALTMSRVYSEPSAEAATLELLALAHRRHRELGRSLSDLQSAALVYEKLNDRASLCRSLSAAGYAAAQLGHQEEMRKYFSRTSLLLPSLTDTVLSARVRLEYGLSLHAFGQNALAAEELRRGISELNQYSGFQSTARLGIRLYAALGEALASEFAYVPARHSFTEAYSLARSQGENDAIGYLLMAIAACDLERSYPSPSPDDYRSVREYYRQATGFFARIGDPHGEAAASAAFGAACESSGSPDSAFIAYRHSYDLMTNSLIESNPAEDDILDFSALPFNTSLTGLNPEFWFESLAGMLVRNGSPEQAYDVLANGRANLLSNRLREFSFEFRDKTVLEVYSENKRRCALLRSIESELVSQHRQETRNRDLFQIDELQKQFNSEIEALHASTGKIAPAATILFPSPASNASRFAADLRSGTMLCEYLLTRHSIITFLLSKDSHGASVRTTEVRAHKDQRDELIRSLHTQRGDQAKVLRGLFDLFIRPIQASFQERVIIVPPPEMEDIPFHAFLSGKDRTLLDIVDVSYLPHVSFVPQSAAPRKFLSTVLAFGFSTRNSWPLEYELRDVRSFYKEATTYTGESATEERLFSAIGDLLQCSFEYHTDTQVPSRSSFAVSSGSITAAGAEIPVERMTMLYPFSVVYLCDQQSGISGLTPLHAAILLLNGTSSVIANILPSEQKTNKVFSEKFYSTISNGGSGNDAYRAAVLTLKGTTKAAAPYSWGMFFKFGR
ncbi:MAG: CHAT domain-containing protein [Ignavibacteriales bacterium]|nr:CHAT domain-containing protein [Ignavibacteriales bacterium]